MQQIHPRLVLKLQTLFLQTLVHNLKKKKQAKPKTLWCLRRYLKHATTQKHALKHTCVNRFASTFRASCIRKNTCSTNSAALCPSSKKPKPSCSNSSLQYLSKTKTTITTNTPNTPNTPNKAAASTTQTKLALLFIKCASNLTSFSLCTRQKMLCSVSTTILLLA